MAKTGIGKHPGETLLLSALFNINGGASAGDFDVTFNPELYADYDPITFLITVANGDSDKVIDVTATAKVPAEFVSGKSSATAQLTVTPAP